MYIGPLMLIFVCVN